MKGTSLPTRLNDISQLNLQPHFESQLKKAIHDNRMQYELWMESAVSFQDFIGALRKRRYKILPNFSKPMFSFHLNNPRKNNIMNPVTLSKLSNKKMLSRQSRKKI